jgi:hypothetical protein
MAPGSLMASEAIRTHRQGVFDTMEAWHTEQDALEQRVTALEARLRARLSPEDFRLVRQLRQAEELAAVAACAAWEARLSDALAHHFPAQELAIRGVIAHIRATNADCDTLQGRPAGRQGA